jgi:hypothetical protein
MADGELFPGPSLFIGRWFARRVEQTELIQVYGVSIKECTSVVDLREERARCA